LAECDDDTTPASTLDPLELDNGGSNGDALNVAGTDFVVLRYIVCVCVIISIIVEIGKQFKELFLALSVQNICVILAIHMYPTICLEYASSILEAHWDFLPNCHILL
jgi:hypothetical protein